MTVSLTAIGSRASSSASGKLAVGETAILLHPALPSVGVAIWMQRGRQQNGRLAKLKGLRHGLIKPTVGTRPQQLPGGACHHISMHAACPYAACLPPPPPPAG